MLCKTDLMLKKKKKENKNGAIILYEWSDDVTFKYFHFACKNEIVTTMQKCWYYVTKNTHSLSLPVCHVWEFKDLDFSCA